MKLLLADDEPDMIRALSAILTHEGYKVDAVYDGAEALEKVNLNARTAGTFPAARACCGALQNALRLFSSF